MEPLIAAARRAAHLRLHRSGSLHEHGTALELEKGEEALPLRRSVPGSGREDVLEGNGCGGKPAACRCGAREGKDEWFQLWPNDAVASDPDQAPCLAEQMSLVYDPVADD
uniref:Uncharacterized protein n=1 Tax=Oryza glumipatula TaxID=40148 RepID=A0A0D9Y2Z5_9ORYZ